MKPKYFFFISALIIIPIIIMLISLFFLSKKEKTVPVHLPTPTSFVPVSENKNPGIVTVQPQNGETHVDAKQPLTITLERELTSHDFIVGTFPYFQHTTEIQGKNVIVKPTSPLLPGTTYEYEIKYKDGNFSNRYSFTTSGNAPSISAPPDNIPLLEEDWYRISQPDLFLYNKMPYETNDFSVTGEFTPTPTEHFFFTVIGKTANGKQAFLDWVKSLDLSDEQIQSLDIRY